MWLIDFIKRRKNIAYTESEGINLAIYLINEFKNRRFIFKGLKKRYSEISSEELKKLLQEEMDSMILLYRYSTKVKKYTDKNGISQMKIKLIGRASSLSRYNPLDIELSIITEK